MINDKTKLLKFCVAGYRGKVGSYILNGLIKYLPTAVNIYCFDTGDTAEDIYKRIKDSDIIFNCISFEETLNFLEFHKEDLKNKIVIDQSSWKTDVFNWNMKNKDIRIEYMHILFDPSRTPKEDRHILLFTSVDLKMNRYYEIDGFDLNDFCKKGLESDYMFFNEPTFRANKEQRETDHHCNPNICLLRRIIKEHDETIAYQQPMLYDALNKVIKDYEKKFHRDQYDYETRNFKKLRELVDRINTMSPTLKQGLYKNPFYKKLKETK